MNSKPMGRTATRMALALTAFRLLLQSERARGRNSMVEWPTTRSIVLDGVSQVPI
jgi:hypothetical protein